ASLAAVALAVALPWPVLVTSLLWVLLVRPGAEPVTLELGGITATDVDAAIVLATVAAAAVVVLPRRRTTDLLDDAADRSPSVLTTADWLWVLAWPAWFVARAALPDVGTAAVGAAPLVDLRLLEAFLLLLPLAVVATRRGALVVVRGLIGVAALASVIAVLGAVALRSGVLPPMELPVVNLSGAAARDVRPGAEIVVVISAVVLLLSRTVAGRLRPLLLGLLGIELLVSQTLSMVLAIAAGVGATLLAAWRRVSTGVRLGAAVLLLASLALVSGVLDPGGRYDLAQRSEQVSGQYRLSEVRTMTEAITETPLTALVGPGVGTELAFAGELVNSVKRDSHNVFLTIMLKSGLVGLVLFVAPLARVAVRAARRGGEVGRALGGAAVAVLVVSLTVPWWWTVNGMVAVLALYVASAAYGNVPRGRP
ncbi:O-antigen ligase family protein, partial [Cellulomonas septica]